MLPVPESIYNYRTDIREDIFHVITDPGQSTITLVLVKAVYADDSQTIAVTSNCSADIPLVDSYMPATRVVSISGLAESESHTLIVAYDVDALAAHSSINTFLGWLPTIWVLILFTFPVCVIYVIIRNWRQR
jgi:hypothetical protein